MFVPHLDLPFTYLTFFSGRKVDCRERNIILFHHENNCMKKILLLSSLYRWRQTQESKGPCPQIAWHWGETLGWRMCEQQVAAVSLEFVVVPYSHWKARSVCTRERGGSNTWPLISALPPTLHPLPTEPGGCLSSCRVSPWGMPRGEDWEDDPEVTHNGKTPI